jgi:hypothetical protein
VRPLAQPSGAFCGAAFQEYGPVSNVSNGSRPIENPAGTKKSRPRAEDRGAGSCILLATSLVLDSQIPRAALPIHQQKSFVLRAAEGALEIRCVPDGVTIHFLNHVAAL